jgi:hypothetical protein
MCGAFLATVGEVVAEHDRIELADDYDVASIGDTGVLVGLAKALRPALERGQQDRRSRTSVPATETRSPAAATRDPRIQEPTQGTRPGVYAELGERIIGTATRLEGSRQIPLPDQPQLDARVRDGVLVAVDRRLWMSAIER